MDGVCQINYEWGIAMNVRNEIQAQYSLTYIGGATSSDRRQRD